MSVRDDGAEPECCGKKMEEIPLPYCTHAYDPEATRPLVASGS